MYLPKPSQYLTVPMAATIATSAYGAIPSQHAPPQNIKPAVVQFETPHKMEPRRPQLRDRTEVRFAENQIDRYKLLLSRLNERQTVTLDPVDRARLDKAITRLDSSLREARIALSAIHSKPWLASDAFAKESLRGSLFSVQEAANQAIGIVVEMETRGSQVRSETEVSGIKF